ncbi:MAG: YhcH/YjgK/YiaL family protein [Bacteroidota bacterium]
MVTDTISNAGKYEALHPLFSQAFQFLKSQTADTVTPGTHELDGRNLFVIISRTDGQLPGPSRLEAHREYIDIQVAMRGSFDIGWKKLSSCKQLAEAYADEKDIMFFDDEPEMLLTIDEGMFGIFFPEDAHAPQTSDHPLVKAVFKVRVR